MTPAVAVGVSGYRIERVLGRGGMSVVYLAEQLSLGRKVALKVLSPELSRDEPFRQRFVVECRTAAGLESPFIVPIYDAGESDGRLYMAMRNVDGPTLSALLRSEGVLEPRRALAIVDQVAAALDVAHGQELVHGDVKPGNILVEVASAPGAVDHCYLTDFGLARRASSWLSLTEQGHFMGTIDYTPPEVIEEGAIDGRADVYSLGCLLYECLSGSPPFPRTTEVAVTYAHLEDPPPMLTARRPDLPSAIDAVIQKAMAKQPDGRYDTCGALVADARVAMGEPGEPTAVPSLVRQGRRGRRSLDRTSRKRGLLRLSVAALLVALVGVAATGVLRAVHHPLIARPARSEVFSISLQEGVPIRVSTGAAYDRQVTFSPTGSKLAFGTLRDGNAEIYVMNANGTGITNITNNDATDSQPSWSPTGERIAFVSDREGGNAEIYVMRIDGSSVHRLTFDPGSEWDPAWSPDGQFIAFTSNRGGNDDIYVMAANGGRVTNITRHAGADRFPTWSPEGTRLAFSSARDGNREIYVVDRNGTNLRRLTIDTGADQGPAWSPDGKSIAFVSDRAGNKDIYVTNLAGSSLRRLTTDRWDEFNPTWSVDGSAIYYTRLDAVQPSSSP
jgi:serine/threonine-protein kinase